MNSLTYIINMFVFFFLFSSLFQNVTSKKYGLLNDIMGFFEEKKDNFASMFGFGKTVGNYTIDSKINSGAFGQVSKGTFKYDQSKNVAIKIIKNEDLPEDDDLKEVKIMQKLKGHQNIVRIIEYQKKRYELQIVMELAPYGNLEKKLKKSGGRLSEKEVKIIIKDVLQGLEYMHKKQIIHKDIKPANILNFGNSYKLTDFGISEICYYNVCQEPSGTPLYSAPEVYYHGAFRYNYFTLNADIWSVGILAYELLGGNLRHLAYDLNYNSTKYSGYPNVVTSKMFKFSWEAISFLQECLTFDPNKRIDATTALNHSWIRDDNLTSSYIGIFLSGAGDSQYVLIRFAVLQIFSFSSVFLASKIAKECSENESILKNIFYYLLLCYVILMFLDINNFYHFAEFIAVLLLDKFCGTKFFRKFFSYIEVNENFYLIGLIIIPFLLGVISENANLPNLKTMFLHIELSIFLAINLALFILLGDKKPNGSIIESYFWVFIISFFSSTYLSVKADLIQFN